MVWSIDDYACDIDQVYTCLNAATCSTIAPSSSDGPSAWTLTTFEPNPGPIITDIIPCYSWESGYNFLADDTVCNVEPHGLWRCGVSGVLGCETTEPNTLNSGPWAPLNLPNDLRQISKPEQPTITCWQFDQVIANTVDHTFAFGDYACDADRVWKCMGDDATLCN